jgi:mannobiose 2-epimerase
MDIDKLKNELEQELKSILDYWLNNSIDEEYGGFYGKIDYYNKPDPESSKGIILNTRILWTFSAAYNLIKNRKYLKAAHRAYRHLTEYFLDEKYGGFYWEVDKKGRPVNTRKQIYAQAFGIYSLSEYYMASGKSESILLAKGIFRLIEKYSFDNKHKGYIEALDREWKELKDLRLSSKEINVPKTMNTHLHVLESYSNLLRVWKNKDLKIQLKNLINIFLKQIIDPGTGHFKLFFEKDWTSKLSIISYGHDIEGSWLLTEAAELTKDKALISMMKETAVKITDSVVNEGLDSNCSLFYEYDAERDHLDTDKHWWPQGEAMAGLVNSWQISGNKKYMEFVFDIWNFIKNYISNKEFGEWDGRVDKDNKPYKEDVRTGFWKCPYHNSRACMEVIKRLS